MENDLFEGWCGSFQRRFSSRSVSQRCVYVWTSARAPIQECELAKDIIKAMSVLIRGLTFKIHCLLRAVFFSGYCCRRVSYIMEKALDEGEIRLLFGSFCQVRKDFSVLSKMLKTVKV